MVSEIGACSDPNDTAPRSEEKVVVLPCKSKTFQTENIADIDGWFEG